MSIIKYKRQHKMIVALITIIFLITADRFLKYLAINNYFQPAKLFVGEIFKLNFAANYQIAFSLPIFGWWLTFLIIGFIIALTYQLLFFFKKKQTTKAVLLFAVIVGATSNLIDRIKYGFVIDYLDLKYFTVFNLADAMIVVGVVGLGLLMLKTTKN